MRIEIPAPFRHTSELIDSTLTITNSVKRRWYFLVFMCLWFAIWTMVMVGLLLATVTMLVIVLSNLSQEPVSAAVWVFPAFLFLMFAFVGVMFFFGLKTFLWAAAGKEVIVVDPMHLTITTHFWKWKHSKTYALAQAANFSVVEINFWSSFQLTRDPMRTSLKPRISFDYGAKEIYFGNELNAAEARQIIAEIRQHMERLAEVPEVL